MAIYSKATILEKAKDKEINLLGDFKEANIKGSSYDLRIGTFFLKKKISMRI